MKVDTPGIAAQIVLVVALSFGLQLAFELLCLKFVYSKEEYQDVLERERNIKVKIANERHKLLYGQVSANKKKQ